MIRAAGLAKRYGEKRIFSLARCFRNRERGALHHPEFTMLEWYRTREPYQTLMDDCVSLIAAAARICGQDRLSFGGRTADPGAKEQRR